MESIIIQTKNLVESNITIPPFFSIKGRYSHYKIISPSTYISVTNYEANEQSMENLELYPSVKVDHVRYLDIFVNGKELVEITEEEFKKQYKKCVNKISKL
jgi:hypothetical protein